MSEPGEDHVDHSADDEVVIEQLTFRVERALVPARIEQEGRCWDAFLSGQPGFLGKQVWAEEDEADVEVTTVVHVMVWWASRSLWKAVPADDIRRAEAAMGDLRRQPACRAHRVARVVGQAAVDGRSAARPLQTGSVTAR